MMRPFVAMALAPSLGLALMIAACGGDSEAAPSAPLGNSANIAVSMVDNQFVPAAINISSGVPVTITASNDGAAVHNLLVTVDGVQHGTDILVNPGSSSSFEVTFPEPGDYEFVCGLHLPSMKGTISVE